VVSDNLLHADYISMASGAKRPRDSIRTIQCGGLFRMADRFTIEGQEPFVASKGWLVQVPYRNIYSMETIGDKPSLRLEVMVANATTMYPADETPTPIPGVNFIKVNTRNAARGKYDAVTKPFLDFNTFIADGKFSNTPFVKDVRAFANIIRGRQADRDNPADNGHLHEVSGEFWMVLEGQIEYKIAAFRFCGRSGGYCLCASADIPSRPSCRYRTVDAPGNERLPGYAAQLSDRRRTSGAGKISRI